MVLKYAPWALHILQFHIPKLVNHRWKIFFKLSVLKMDSLHPYASIPEKVLLCGLG
jgi:hypothetical protein